VTTAQDVAPARCSVLARAAGEPLTGSAPRAHAWLVLEQPGPYGFSALTESHLPEAVREALGALPKDSGTTVVLARRVGRHADDHTAVERRRFWFAHVSPGGVRMRSGLLDDAELLRPDLAEVVAGAARGELPAWGSRSEEPLLLVCTNSRRDVCCALEGRPVAEALAQDPAYSGRVLEASHLGGHRFAPTALLLPSGHAFGRLDPGTAREVLDAAARDELGPTDRHRGRTSLPQAAQAAETAVRAAAGVTGLDDLDALRRAGDRAVPAGLRWSGDDGVAQVEVRHRDGRAWHVTVTRETLPEPKPESCGKKAVDAHVWTAGPVADARPWA
jgi:hypothetical protein